MTDHHCRLQYADSGQPQFSNWEETSIGDTGEYDTRAVFTQLGMFRQRVLRVRVSSRRRRDLLGAVAVLKPTNG